VADLPPLVDRAVRLARREGFGNSCRPEQGRLLFALAAGARVIGETGTGQLRRVRRGRAPARPGPGRPGGHAPLPAGGI